MPTAPTATAFVTPPDAPRWQRLLVFSPVARIVIFCVMFAILSIGAVLLMRFLGWGGKDVPPMAQALASLMVRAVVPLLAYLLLVRCIERRHPTELAPRRWLPEGAIGIILGLLLFSSVVGMLWLLGSYHVTGSNPHAPWLPALLVVGLGAGIGEEIIFRGVLFRIVEEGLGTWWALAISAFVFGAAHMGNPGATAWSSAAIVIEAGLLFGMLYHVSRSLPLCMGVHAAWNFAQGTIYGIPVSGSQTDGWLTSTRTGPDWLSGGVFGAEASVVAIGLCSVCTLALLVYAWRRHTMLPPLHQRRALRSAESTTAQ